MEYWSLDDILYFGCIPNFGLFSALNFSDVEVVVVGCCDVLAEVGLVGEPMNYILHTLGQSEVCALLCVQC